MFGLTAVAILPWRRQGVGPSVSKQQDMRRRTLRSASPSQLPDRSSCPILSSREEVEKFNVPIECSSSQKGIPVLLYIRLDGSSCNFGLPPSHYSSPCLWSSDDCLGFISMTCLRGQQDYPSQSEDRKCDYSWRLLALRTGVRRSTEQTTQGKNLAALSSVDGV